MKRILTISILVLGISMLSCKKESISPQKSMEQFYYTVEGSKYVLRTDTKTENIIGHAGSALPLQVFVNLPQIPTVGVMTSLSMNEQSNQIIPVSCMLGITQAGAGITADIQSIYYGATRGNAPNSNTFDQLKAISKLIPLSESVLNTNDNNYRYSIRYSQAVLQDKDFIDPTGGITFVFDRNLGNALTDQPNGGSPVTIPAGNFRATIVFTYFELVK